jgi:mitogen-activated protein kinase 1/3
MEEQEWRVTSKYRIVSYVGSGVYGQVVRARLSSDLSKTVVIKRTSDVFRWGPGFAKYALREIAIMRRLNHPNIVKILDILKPEEGERCSEIQCQFFVSHPT